MNGWSALWRATALSLLLLALQMGVWRWAHEGQPGPVVEGPVAGLAYSGFQRWQSPLAQRYPSPTELRHDLERLAAMTTRLRTYSSSEFEGLPALAVQQGLRLTSGVWLRGDAQADERELQAVLAAAAAHPEAIERVIAGNETRLHDTLPLEQLIAHLDRLRRVLKVPVSTAEPWHVWLAEPRLAEHADFIAVHLLPYWEGVPASVAVHEVWRRYEQIRQRFPGKPVVIAEVGWPSGGATIERQVDGWLNRATATPAEQARFLREFVATARRRPEPVDYFLMEAIDQPWKAAVEGPAGAHWGVLDASRRAKFDWTGPVERDPYWRGRAVVAGVLGVLMAWPFLVAFPHLRLSARLAFGISVQALAALVVVLGSRPLDDYLRLFDAALLALLVPALLLMTAILVTQALEFAELFWDGQLRHRAQARPWSGTGQPPMVSVQVACSNEPPEMVLATIRSLQRLNWPALEILVVDNNTADPAVWRPVRAYIAQQRQAGDGRLQFIRLPRWPGYKAGALNVALARTHPEARWVAVVDADYLVRPDWIERVAGHFQDPTVAVVQAPQAHRGWRGDRLSRMMNWEYEGFFRLGMHHRHERNAIVQHGTMTLIRTSTLKAVGGWATDCVCEDTELGLRLLRAGWRKVYVDEVMGSGLLPQDFAAYQRQRQRWAQGAMQILRRHAAALIGARDGLRAGQRYHFVAGWLPWIGDLFHLLFSLSAIAWSFAAAAAPDRFALPPPVFALPLLLYFSVRLVLVPLLYWRRVPCSTRDRWGAAWAGMALSHAIAVGVFRGLVGRRAVFHVTPKQAGPTAADRRSPRGQAWSSVRAQALLLAGLCVAGLALLTSAPSPSWALSAWWLVLGLQGLPYLAALSCAALVPAEPQGEAGTVEVDSA